MVRCITLLFASLALLFSLPARADEALDNFAREVDRAQSVRAVLDLQRNFAQYAGFGLWNQIGALFPENGELAFDGAVGPEVIYSGQQEITAFLRNRYGGGFEGTSANSLSSLFIENPVINLSVDGTSAKGRWNMLAFYGAAGEAHIEGGIIEADYVRQAGTWKIGTLHYYPQFYGPYEDGWVNWGGGDLPQIPHHFDVYTSGQPIPPAEGAAPATSATLAQLQAQVDRMNDEDRVRSLQSAYGFYVDRKMWDDVVDLFSDQGVVEIGGQGVWRGKPAVRRWLNGSMGPAGLTHGQLNDQVQMDVTVEIAPGGNEAWARGIDLGMLGEADNEQGWWAVTPWITRFVYEGGVWKIREHRRFPQMKTDIFEGWGKSRIVDPTPAGSAAPTARLPQTDRAPAGLAMPRFLGTHPVTGERVGPEGDGVLVATAPLTSAVAPKRFAAVDLAEAERRLARSTAFDGIQNVSSVYGYYLDDSMPRGFGGVIAENGTKMTPFAGYYITRDRVLEARVSGDVPQTRPGISYHWLVQPVVMISEDGRSASGRFRLFQPRTGKEVGGDGAFMGANFWGGMYHNQYSLEDGTWRIWELTLDEPYIVPVSWKNGLWAKAKDPAEPRRGGFSGGNFPPDVPLTELGRREEHFWGGTGETLQWPSQLNMWFQYSNPVSGREPEFFQKTCVTCTLRPDMELSANGYQTPPDLPQAMRRD